MKWILEYFNYEPPSFLRFFVPWFVLSWIDKRFNVCWSGIVMWKMGYDWGWEINDSCFQWYEKNIFSAVKPCFCGKYPRGKWGKNEEQINEALLESKIHWDHNVENFPTNPDAIVHEWFATNCSGDMCALCELFMDVKNMFPKCSLCLLNDSGYTCCQEWHYANLFETSKETITAVRDRIEAECKKRGLL